VIDPVTGEAIAAFVIGGGGEVDVAALKAHVRAAIGPVAVPREIHVVPDLPKTRSGKIMRRLLADIVDGRPLGDTTSLQDESVPHTIEKIVSGS